MAAPWVLVAWGEQFRAELNSIAPNRDKASDGSVGDLRHQGSPSGHNPDETGNAERRDADNINEVRAIDVDKDLRLPGLTAEMIVAYLVGRCRAGLEKRLIYIIFNRTIWSASSGWVAKRYTGSNPHDKHFHLSGHPDGDNDRRSFGLASLVGKKPPAAPKPPAKLVADGRLGPKTIRRWQQVMGTPVDGKISEVSVLVKAVQRHLNAKIKAGLVVDGRGIRQDGRRYKTVKALQRYLGTEQDGIMSVPVSTVVKALQTRLNSGRF